MPNKITMRHLVRKSQMLGFTPNDLARGFEQHRRKVISRLRANAKALNQTVMAYHAAKHEWHIATGQNPSDVVLMASRQTFVKVSILKAEINRLLAYHYDLTRECGYVWPREVAEDALEMLTGGSEP